MSTFQLPTRFGPFGGCYAPETLMANLVELEAAFVAAGEDPAFEARFAQLLGEFAGRPTPLFEARRLSEQLGVELWLKREDLLHTGAHKLNNAIGQALLAQRMAELRSHGIVSDAERFERPVAGPWVYEQQQLGFNYRMTDIQAALGLSQLQQLDQIVVERNCQLQRYQELLADLPVQLLKVPDDVGSSVHLAVVRLQQATAEQHRQVFEGLRSAGIGVQLHYSPVHLQPYYRALGFAEGQYPQAEAYASSAISLPLFPGLSAADQQRVGTRLAEQLRAAALELAA